MSRELARLHVEALFTHDGAADLVSVNDTGAAPAPRIFLAMTPEGVLIRFRHDVDAATRKDLEAMAARGPSEESALTGPIEAGPYEAILARRTPVQRTWAGPAFSFPDELRDADAIAITDVNASLLAPLLSEWLPDVPMAQPMYAQVVEGRAVSICASVRLTREAHEAGVETASMYRRQGYASAPVLAWARAVRMRGLVPLYSTSWQNTASRALARKIGLFQFANDLHIL